MSKQIPDKIVQRAWDAYVQEPHDHPMRAALEASGAVFLTDEERETLKTCVYTTLAMFHQMPHDASSALRSALEALDKNASTG